MNENLERDVWELERLLARIGAYRNDTLAEQYSELATQRDRLTAIVNHANQKDAA